MRNDFDQIKKRADSSRHAFIPKQDSAKIS